MLLVVRQLQLVLLFFIGSHGFNSSFVAVIARAGTGSTCGMHQLIGVLDPEQSTAVYYHYHLEVTFQAPHC